MTQSVIFVIWPKLIVFCMYNQENNRFVILYDILVIRYYKFVIFLVLSGQNISMTVHSILITFKPCAIYTVVYVVWSVSLDSQKLAKIMTLSQDLKFLTNVPKMSFFKLYRCLDIYWLMTDKYIFIFKCMFNKQLGHCVLSQGMPASQKWYNIFFFLLS